MSTQKCKTCAYEQVIHSAGVHMNENGCIQVYSEEDFFFCPNCSDPFENLNEHQKGMFQHALTILSLVLMVVLDLQHLYDFGCNLKWDLCKLGSKSKIESFFCSPTVVRSLLHNHAKARLC